MSDEGERSEFDELARERLFRAIGPAQAPATIEEAMSSLGLSQLRSPTELLRFAEQLMQKGGVFESVGRGLKISALLKGAVPPS